MERHELIDTARRVLRLEGDAVLRLEGRIGDDFVRAVEMLAGLKGRAIVTGLGKSGIAIKFI